MWYVMAKTQEAYHLSERLVRAISNWQNVPGQDDDVEDLLEAGAEVNRQHGMMLPLHTACMVGDVDVAQVLVEHGAQVNVIDGYRRAALHYAAERSIDCLELLLDNGADPNIRDGNKDTALHWASFKNNHACVRMLLQRGAFVDVLDYNSDTPLSWAAMKGNLESIKVLLEFNASVDTSNYSGKTPLTRAATIPATGLNTDKDDACLELILKAFGQFDMREADGNLPNPISEDNKLCETLMTYCCNVRPLQQLCRYKIRTNLGPRMLLNVVPTLPLPPSLQDYVLLQR